MNRISLYFRLVEALAVREFFGAAGEFWTLSTKLINLTAMKTALLGLSLAVAFVFGVSCKSSPSNSPTQSSVREADANPPTTYTADVETDMKFGEALITGGWQTGPGRRAYFVAVPELIPSSTPPREGKPKQVLVSGHLFEMIEQIFEENDFPKLNTDSTETSSFELARAENYADFPVRFDGARDTRIMATPKTVTLDGHPATLQISRALPIQETEGDYLKPGFKVTFTPEVSEDNESVKLAIDIVWTISRVTR